MSAAQEWTPAAIELMAMLDAKTVERELAAARQGRTDTWNAQRATRERAAALRQLLDRLIAPDLAAALGGVSVLTRSSAESGVTAYGYATWIDAALELTPYGDGLRVAVTAPWGESSHLAYVTKGAAPVTLIDVLADVERERRRWRAELDEHAACMAEVTRAVDAARASYAYVTLAPPRPLWRWQWTGAAGEPLYGWSHTGTLDGAGEALLWHERRGLGGIGIWQIGYAKPSAELYAYGDMFDLTRTQPDLSEQITIDVPGIGYARVGGPGGFPWRVKLAEGAPPLTHPTLRLYADPAAVLSVEALRRPCWYVRFLNDYAIDESMPADAVLELVRDYVSAPAAVVSAPEDDR